MASSANNLPSSELRISWEERELKGPSLPSTRPSRAHRAEGTIKFQGKMSQEKMFQGETGCQEGTEEWAQPGLGWTGVGVGEGRVLTDEPAPLLSGLTQHPHLQQEHPSSPWGPTGPHPHPRGADCTPGCVIQAWTVRQGDWIPEALPGL